MRLPELLKLNLYSSECQASKIHPKRLLACVQSELVRHQILILFEIHLSSPDPISKLLSPSSKPLSRELQLELERRHLVTKMIIYFYFYFAAKQKWILNYFASLS